MSERKPEDCVVTINAYDFLKTLQEESNKKAANGLFISGKNLFYFCGKIFSDKVNERGRNSPMFEKHDKIVRYDHWCQNCKNKDAKENEDPCEECLSNPINETEKPLRFEEK